MQTSRRTFLKKMSAGMGSLGLLGVSIKSVQADIEKYTEKSAHVSDAEIARDEDFWFKIQQAFDIDRSIINLNNGGVHPAPEAVMDAVHRYLDFSNGAPPYNLWRVLRPRRELIRKRLADTFGCSPEEIAITRNVTESMHIPLMGIDLKQGDEVLTTTHDYPSMKNALFQREMREGVKVKTFSFKYPPKNLKELVDLFEENITSRTRLILVCHITNLTGQIFPIKDICRVAREKNIEVAIDGAHAFGHFVFSQKDLDCDIYGGNLHKWMMAPVGTGFLYVKKEKIKKIWPLFPAPNPKGDDIRKFEHIGTRPEYLELAVADALTFHHGIGPGRKEERLRYLRDYWAKKLEKLPGVKILTSYDPAQSCGIGTFLVEKMDMGLLSKTLFDKHKIYTICVGVPHPEKGKADITAMRVTPSIYTTLRELNIFIEAVEYYIRNGISG
ncbi:MAG: aminotransferase class V-fold PLP-dependent enzyme [Candidatus Aminicenantes bacterium]|nr:aminotransferase class V-fold PLP-dependent enzyme [Candidatus Aminicenantes bacterium]